MLIEGIIIKHKALSDAVNWSSESRDLVRCSYEQNLIGALCYVGAEISPYY